MQKLTSHKLIQCSPSVAGSRHFLKAYCYRGCKLSIVAQNSQVVHVLSGQNIAITVHSPWGVLDACISAAARKSLQLFLLIIGLSGTIFRISLSSVLKSDGETGNDQPPKGSGSIFDNLLEGEDSPEPASIILAESDILVSDPGAVRLISVGQYLVTIGHTAVGHVIHLYSWMEEGTSVHEGAVYSVETCLSSLPSTHVAGAHPLLHCVYPKGLADSLSICSTSGHSAIDRRLYGQLFGMERAMLDVPVLLIACSTGHVYTMSLHGGTHPNSRPKLLCDLQQPAVGIFGMHVPSNNNDGPNGGGDGGKNANGMATADMVCLLGASGKLLTISVDKTSASSSTNTNTTTRDGGSPTAWSSCELYVNGPVGCWVLLGIRLLHWTGCQLLVTDLRQVRTQQVHSHLTSNAFSGGRACSMVAHGGNNEWLGLTTQGHLYRHVLSDTDSTSSDDLMTALSNRESLKNLLTGISLSSDQLAQAQRRATDLDTTLSQLALCGYIQATQNQTDQSAVPLRCSVCVDRRQLGSRIAVEVRVQVVNQCAVTLSDGWCVAIGVSANCGAAEAMNVESGWGWRSGNVCKVFPLVLLARGDHQDVVIPLSALQIENLPLTVDIQLSFSATPPPGLVTSQSLRTITIPVLVCVIDILHCLESSGARCHVDTVLARSTLRTQSELVRLARSRPCWDSNPFPPSCVSIGTVENLSMLCFVSDRHGSNHKGEDEAPSPELHLLRLLVADSAITVPTDGTHVIARSVVTGQQVTLLVRCATTQETSILGETGAMLVVVLEAADQEVLFQLHTAVTDRLRKLADYSEMQLGHTRAAKYEEVWQQALRLTDKTCGIDYSQQQAADDIMELFSTLRSITH